MTLEEKYNYLQKRIERLNNISLSLSREDDINVIFELILEEAKYITNADGRTLYMRNDDGLTMDFQILQNDSMGLMRGGTSGKKIRFSSIPLYDEGGEPNMKNVNTYVTHMGKTLNVNDAYKEDGFDFSGKLIWHLSHIYIHLLFINHQYST